MSDDIAPEHRAIAHDIAESATLDERAKLLAWMKALLEIRASDRTVMQKTVAAFNETRRANALFALIIAIARELKRIGWDERGWAARLGLGGAAAAAIGFGGAGAGIAALGGAIGVPLWIVVGAGGAFAGTLIDELERSIARSKK